MITKNKIAFGCAGILAGAIIFMAACHKNTSSSSASGSLSGAISDLALVAINNAHNEVISGGTVSFPLIGLSCSGITNSPASGAISYTNTGGATGCPSGYTNLTTYNTPSSFTSTFANCVVSGYTFSGTLSLSIPGGALLNACQILITPTDTSLVGSYTLSSTSFTITGNGISESCTPSQPMSGLTAAINYVSNTSTLKGTLSGSACGGSLSSLSFYWQ